MFRENIPLLLRLFQFNDYFPDSPFKWDHVDPIPKLKQPKDIKSRRRFGKIALQIHLICTLVCVCQFIFQPKSSSSATSASEYLSLVAIGCFFIAHVHLRECLKHDEDIVLCVNGHIEFDICYNNRKKSPRNFWRYFMSQKNSQKLNTLFASGIYLSLHVFPLGYVYGLHIINPCKPSLLGYWLLEECSPSWGYSFPHLKLILITVNYMVWAYECKLTPLMFGLFQSVTMTSLQENIALFRSYYRESTLPHEELVVMYRKIQILATLGNLITQHGLRPAFMATIVGTQSLFTVSLVISSLRISGTDADSTEDFVILVVSVIGLVDTTLSIMVSFGGMAFVYKDSRETLEDMKLNLGVSNAGIARREKQKFINSCQIIKIRFGSYNFMDEKTPLTCIDFSNDVTVNCLLTAKAQ